VCARSESVSWRARPRVGSPCRRARGGWRGIGGGGGEVRRFDARSRARVGLREERLSSAFLYERSLLPSPTASSLLAGVRLGLDAQRSDRLERQFFEQGCASEGEFGVRPARLGNAVFRVPKLSLRPRKDCPSRRPSSPSTVVAPSCLDLVVPCSLEGPSRRGGLLAKMSPALRWSVMGAPAGRRATAC